MAKVFLILDFFFVVGQRVATAYCLMQCMV
jgi:hypothetical protein